MANVGGLMLEIFRRFLFGYESWHTGIESRVFTIGFKFWIGVNRH